MQFRQSVFKTRWLSWLTLIIFFVFSVMPPSGFAAVVQTVGADGKITYLTDSDTVWELGSFDQAAGAIWDFDLSRGNLQVNVTGADKTTWAGTSNIFGGILGLFNPNGIHFTETSQINLTNAGFIGAAMRAVDGTNLNNLKLAGNGYLLNEGKMTGGNIALLGGAVENKGLIDAPLNQVTIAGGKAMTVGLSGDNLISVVVDEATDTNVKDFDGRSLSDQIKNSGNVTAHKITLNAKGVDSVFEKAINLKGELKAVDVDTNDRGQLVMMSLDDVYSKAILDASRIYIRANSGDIDMMGITRAKELDEKGASFQIGGTFQVENSYHDNLDRAITYAANANVSGTVNDAVNIVVNAGVTLNLTGNTTFRADYDVLAAPGSESNGSGAFLMDATATIIGNDYDLTIKASENSTLGVITGVDMLTLAGNVSYTPTYTSSTSVDDIDVNTFKTNKDILFIKTVGTGADAAHARLIYDINQLQDMSSHLGYYYKLANNIDASSTVSWNGGAGFNPVGTFTGTLNGQNYVINDLFINRSEDKVGLFKEINGATISNLGLANVDITGGVSSGMVGAFAGHQSSGSSITNSFGTGTVRLSAGSQLGGLVGFNDASSISNSYFSGDVIGGSGSSTVGGLVGQNYGSISNSYFTGNVTGFMTTGGLVGTNTSGAAIDKSYATGTVSGMNSSIDIAGLAGINQSSATITNSYSTSVVTSGSSSINVGGLVGYNYLADISNSYFGGSISSGSGSTFVGGVIGQYDDGTYSNNYWDYQTAGLASTQDTGDDGNISGITSLTTAQMNGSSNFSGWDFTEGGDHWNSFSGSAPHLDFEWASSITNLLQLQNMQLSLAANYSLANDIDASASRYWNSGAGFNPVGVYSTGTFDGQNHTISNLFINRPTTDDVGLFSALSNAHVSDLSFTNADITGKNQVGTLAGTSSGSVVSGVSVAGSITSGDTYRMIGGLIGHNTSSSSITNSSFSGAINVGAVAFEVGGIVGRNDTSSSITGSSSSGTIVGDAGAYAVGGLAGFSYDHTTISNSHSSMSVTGGANAYQLAGLVGANDNYASISNSYATGAVNGDSGSQLGGLVGDNQYHSTISDSYSTGNVTDVSDGSYIGGFVGSNQSHGTITNSYATGNVIAGNSATNIGGFVGYNYNASLIQRSYSSGSVTAGNDAIQVGGFVGFNSYVFGVSGSESSILNSYTVGDVTVGTSADSVGGFGGNNWGSSINFAYADNYITAGSGLIHSGGFVGPNAATSNSTVWNKSKNPTMTDDMYGNPSGDSSNLMYGYINHFTTAEMKDASLFEGLSWDLNTIWAVTGSSAPDLRMEYNVWNGSGNWSDAANWTKGALTNLSKVLFNSTSTANSTINAGFAGTIAKLFIDTGYTGTITQSRSLTIAGDYLQKAGTLSAGSSATNVSGNWMKSGGTFNAGTGTLNLNGSGAQTLTSGGTNFYNLTHSGSGTATQFGNLNVTHDFTNSAGTFTSSPQESFSVGNSFNTTGGVFNRFTGAGDSGSPYSIYDIYGLQGISGHLGAHYVLANDIDASGATNWNSGLGFNPLGDSSTKFTGDFDGDDHIISGLYINRSSTDYVGLFGFANVASLHDVGLANVNITGQNYTGGLVGQANASTISYAYTTGAVNSGDGVAYIGGLMGYSLSSGAVSHSFSTATITVGNNSQAVGGLVGVNQVNSTISNSYFTGAIIAGNGTANTGGLVGYNVQGGSVQSSYSTGSITSGSSSNSVGGLVGNSSPDGLIEDSYATGNVTAGISSQSIGGLVGLNYDHSTVSGSYSTGAVVAGNSSHEIGGLIGYNRDHGTVTESYTTGSVTVGNSASNVGGFVGLNHDGSSIQRAYSSGDVVVGSSSSKVGGFAGASTYIFGDPDSTPEIINTYTIGNVTAGINSDNVAGSVGLNAGAQFHHNFADNTVTAGAGSTYVGGMIGTNPSGTSNNYWNQSKNPTLTDDVYGNSPSSYTHLTTDEMRDAANFTNFDFSTVWVATGSSRIDLKMEYNVWTGAASNAWSNALNWSKGALTSVSKVIFNGTHTADSSIDSGFGGTIKKLFIDSGYTGTLTQNKNITISGDYLQKAGTYSATDKTITIGGDWTKTGGTFDAGTGKVIFNGINERINGTATFNDLTKTTLTSDTLTFGAGTTQTILGHLTLSGATGNALSLRSSSSGSAWKLDVRGDVTGSQYDDVKDLDLTNSTKSITFYDSINSGNNKNTTFYVPPPPVVVTPEVQAAVNQAVASATNIASPVVVVGGGSSGSSGSSSTSSQSSGTSNSFNQTNFNSNDSGSGNSLINFSSFQQSSTDKLKDVSVALSGGSSSSNVGLNTNLNSNNQNVVSSNSNSQNVISSGNQSNNVVSNLSGGTSGNGNQSVVVSDSNHSTGNANNSGNSNSSGVASNNSGSNSSQTQTGSDVKSSASSDKQTTSEEGSKSSSNNKQTVKSESGSSDDNSNQSSKGEKSKGNDLKKDDGKDSDSSEKDSTVSDDKNSDKKSVSGDVDEDSEHKKDKEKEKNSEKGDSDSKDQKTSVESESKNDRVTDVKDTVEHGTSDKDVSKVEVKTDSDKTVSSDNKTTEVKNDDQSKNAKVEDKQVVDANNQKANVESDSKNDRVTDVKDTVDHGTSDKDVSKVEVKTDSDKTVSSDNKTTEVKNDDQSKDAKVEDKQVVDISNQKTSSEPELKRDSNADVKSNVGIGENDKNTSKAELKTVENTLDNQVNQVSDQILKEGNGTSGQPIKIVEGQTTVGQSSSATDSNDKKVSLEDAHKTTSNELKVLDENSSFDSSKSNRVDTGSDKVDVSKPGDSSGVQNQSNDQTVKVVSRTNQESTVAVNKDQANTAGGKDSETKLGAENVAVENKSGAGATNQVEDSKGTEPSTSDSNSQSKTTEPVLNATKQVETDLIQRAAPVEHVFDKVMTMMSTDVHVTQVELRNGVNNFEADMKEVFKGQDQGVEKFRQMIFNAESKPLADRSPVQVDFEAPRMMFRTVVGKVKVVASDGTIYDAQANKPLNQGDQVWTADDGKAELESGKGNETVTVQANSAVNLGVAGDQNQTTETKDTVVDVKPAPQQSLLTIAFGKVSVDIAGIQDKPSFQVETPSGMSGLRG